MKVKENIIPRPFVKWAGGKTKLLDDIIKRLPNDFKETVDTFVEPFAGGGAVFLMIIRQFPNIKHIIINDLNKPLINAYRVIRDNPNELISILTKYRNTYLSKSQDQRATMYYEIRDSFNNNSQEGILAAARFIFLNKTCFNGLYRVNKSGQFNTPVGKYNMPEIFDESNIRKISEVLKNVEILNLDFIATFKDAGPQTFYYLDPPYKPISKGSSFTAYNSEGFNDNDQEGLAEFCKMITEKGSRFILSNSDVYLHDDFNTFFNTLYDYCTFHRVKAARSINSNGSERGKISELMITNY